MKGTSDMDFFVIFVILIIVFLIYLKFENKNLEVTNYKIRSDKIPESFSGTSFVMLGDLHNNSFGDKNKILIREIDKINPSFIVIAGDLIVGKPREDFSAANSLLTRLSVKYPIYYGLGNHEQRIKLKGRYYNSRWKDYSDSLKKLNIQILDNSSFIIKKGNDEITIWGISIDPIYFKRPGPAKIEDRYLEKLIGKLDSKCYNIVIAHNPIYFKDYIKIKPDLILSGHIHGGIVRLPFLGGMISPQLKLFPKYDGGQFEENGQVMLVSRGLGTHTIKLRVFNRPELMTITLERKQAY